MTEFADQILVMAILTQHVPLLHENTAALPGVGHYSDSIYGYPPRSMLNGGDHWRSYRVS